MARPELGTKRVCGECGAKFYDLNRNPIVCPNCQTTFDPATLAATPAKPARQAEAKPKAEPKAPETEEPEGEDEALVPLEDADAEEASTGRTEGSSGEEEKIPDLEDDSIESEEEERLFDENESTGEDDVSSLIEGDIEDKDE